MNVIRVLSGKSEGKKKGIKTPANPLSHEEYLHKKSGIEQEVTNRSKVKETLMKRYGEFLLQVTKEFMCSYAFAGFKCHVIAADQSFCHCRQELP